MAAHAKQAGPGSGREASFPVFLEAAGPASPRLIIEEVTTRLGTEQAEVIAALAIGSDRFVGSAIGSAGERQIPELAAAAAVAAIQQYLHHPSQDPSTPQVQLLDVVAFTTGIGQQAIAASVRITHDRRQSDLHGSALVRNDRARAAVAAALDAVTRCLGRCAARIQHYPWDASPEQPVAPAHASTEPPLAEPPFTPQARDDVSRPVPVLSARRRPTAFVGFPAVGVVLAPPAIHVAAVDSRGAVIAEAHRPASADADADAVVSQAIHAVREVIGKMDGAGELASIGLAVPGQVAEDDGVCVSSGQFPNWSYVPLTAPFANEFGRPITVIGPTHAAAYAEFSFGAARGIPNLLYTRVDAAIDAALILDGRPMLTQLPSGQAGHIVIEAGGARCACGESGCWQALAGTDSLVARAAKAIRNGTPTTLAAAVHEQGAVLTPALIVRTAASGDAVSRHALEETGHYLALGLANLIALFGPQAVIVEGRPSAVGSALLRAAEASLKSTARASLLSHCVLLSPDLGQSSAAIGAAAWAARSGS